MTTLTLCETCGFDAAVAEAERPGMRLAAEVEALAAAEPELKVRRTRCLMACQRRCTALLRAPGKITYVLGDLAPGGESAAALVAYARHYRQSATGQVPFRDWPAGIKGHFVARIPVLED